MVDEPNKVAGGGRRRWALAIVFNILFWGMLTLVVYVWLTQQRELEISSRIASREIYLGTVYPGTIKRITVEAPDHFTADQVLFEIEDPTLANDLEKTSQSIQKINEDIRKLEAEQREGVHTLEVQDNIQQVKNDIRVTSTMLETLLEDLEDKDDLAARARKEYDSAQAAVEAGTLPRSKLLAYEEAWLQARTERDKVAREIKRLREVNRGGHEDLELQYRKLTILEERLNLDLQKLTDQLRDQNATWKALLNKQERLKHRAGFDGYVVRRLRQEKETVPINERILMASTGEEIWVEAYFTPEDALLVRRGDRLTVRYGTLPPFPVIVDQIMLVSDVTQPVSALVQPKDVRIVKLLFEDPDAARRAGLVPGMHVFTYMKKSQGFLYFLGLKKDSASRSADGPASAPTSRQSPAAPRPAAGDESSSGSV